MQKKDVSIYDLEDSLEAQLDTMTTDYSDSLSRAKNEIELDDYKQDVVNEIIDGIIPIYNYDLLTVAMSNLWLGSEEAEYGSKNAFDCIKEAIYRHLQEKASDYLAKQ